MIKKGLLSLALFLLLVGTGYSQGLKLLPSSKIELDGNSTLHPYFSQSKDFKVSFKYKNQVPMQSDLIAWLKQSQPVQAQLSLPVQSLKSHEKDLDSNLYKALKDEQYPKIQFNMTQYKILSAQTATQKAEVQIEGVLSIAGKEKPISFKATAENKPEGVRVSGKYSLLMSDYGVEPPVIMFVIRCEDQINITFDLLFAGEK